MVFGWSHLRCSSSVCTFAAVVLSVSSVVGVSCSSKPSPEPRDGEAGGGGEGGGGGDSEGEGEGELSINLQVAPGTKLAAVSYTLHGTKLTQSGSIDVGEASAATATIRSLPAASGYTLDLEALSEDDSSICSSSVAFEIEAAKTTSVSTYFGCGGPEEHGDELDDGAINVCPVVDALIAAPSQTSANGTVTLVGEGSDSDGAPSALSYTWTTSGGTLKGASESTARLTSDSPGEFSVTLTVSDGECSDSATTHVTFGPLARRIGPVITHEMLPGTDGENLNGPSPIATPDGLRLYFADHAGTYIRLAFADDPVGPWQVHEPGTFPLSVVLEEAERATTPEPVSTDQPAHIAAPDVHLMDDGRWRMYFHARPNDPDIAWGHENGVATSDDGLDWHLESPKPIRSTYLRGFQWKGEWYGVMRGGELVHSVDGVTWSDPSVPEFAAAVNEAAGPYIRHVALALDGDVLSVFYSRIADAPERIMRATAHLDGSWTEWRLEHPVEVLRPEEDWEGADLPVIPSRGSIAKAPGNELRDPGILDYGGRRYLYYAFRGERGIGVAELTTH